jgi:mycoredoxin
MNQSNNTQIVMYTTDWCSDCWRAKQVMKSLKVNFQEIDISADAEAAAKVIQLNQGSRSVPTILFPDGTILTEPNTTTLVQKLNQFV